jgi:hypothetical protein
MISTLELSPTGLRLKTPMLPCPCSKIAEIQNPDHFSIMLFVTDGPRKLGIAIGTGKEGLKIHA